MQQGLLEVFNMKLQRKETAVLKTDALAHRGERIKTPRVFMGALLFQKPQT